MLPEVSQAMTLPRLWAGVAGPHQLDLDSTHSFSQLLIFIHIMPPAVGLWNLTRDARNPDPDALLKNDCKLLEEMVQLGKQQGHSPILIILVFPAFVLLFYLVLA